MQSHAQGVPGFSYALVRRAVLAHCRGQARSLSLDLEDQVTCAQEWVDSN